MPRTTLVELDIELPSTSRAWQLETHLRYMLHIPQVPKYCFLGRQAMRQNGGGTKKLQRLIFFEILFLFVFALSKIDATKLQRGLVDT